MRKALKEREGWVDLLNVIACAGVLLLHCTNQEIHEFSGCVTIGWIIGIMSHSLFIWPVNVFFMLSGYTLIRESLLGINTWQQLKEFYKRRCSRVLIPVLFWNSVYLIWFLYANRYELEILLEWPNLISKFVQLQFNGTMWFFIPLIGLYISLPFVAFMILSMGRQMQKLFIIIGLALVGIVPYFLLGGYDKLINLFPLGSGYLIIAVLGFYLGKYDISNKKCRLAYMLSIACIILIACGTVIQTLNAPDHYRLFIQYLGYPCIILSMGVFLFVKRNYHRCFQINECQQIMCVGGVLPFLSNLSLGVYLSQILVIAVIRRLLPILNEPDFGIILFIIVYPCVLVTTYMLKNLPLLKYTV